MILHVTDAKYLKDYLIEVTFNDGKKGIADLSQSLQGTVFDSFYEDMCLQLALDFSGTGWNIVPDSLSNCESENSGDSQDADNDGYSVDEDCNDNDLDIHLIRRQACALF